MLIMMIISDKDGFNYVTDTYQIQLYLISIKNTEYMTSCI